MVRETPPPRSAADMEDWRWAGFEDDSFMKRAALSEGVTLDEAASTPSRLAERRETLERAHGGLESLLDAVSPPGSEDRARVAPTARRRWWADPVSVLTEFSSEPGASPSFSGLRKQVDRLMVMRPADRDVFIRGDVATVMEISTEWEDHYDSINMVITPLEEVFEIIGMPDRIRCVARAAPFDHVLADNREHSLRGRWASGIAFQEQDGETRLVLICKHPDGHADEDEAQVCATRMAEWVMSGPEWLKVIPQADKLDKPVVVLVTDAVLDVENRTRACGELLGPVRSWP